MKRRNRLPALIIVCTLLFVAAAVVFQEAGWKDNRQETDTGHAVIETVQNTIETFFDTVRTFLGGEPREVKELRGQEIAQTDEGHQEYYFGLLNEEERRTYRQLLDGFRNREESFYLTITDNDSIDRIFHAVLKDHPEIYWALPIC